MIVSSRWPLALFFLVAPTVTIAEAQTTNPAQTFVGTTPADAPILQQLGIVPGSAELLEWKVTLNGDRYTLHLDYGVTAPNQPGIARNRKSLDRSGTFTSSGNVYRLDGIVLSRISNDVLHIRNADGGLMVGNGGWSYTLVNAVRAEQIPNLRDMTPSFSYTPAPLPTGASVFGIFSGRTPCQGIARELGASVIPACARLKWSIRLLRDPVTGNPATYRTEGSLYWQPPNSAASAGTWTITHGRPGDANAVIYRLSASGSEHGLSLLKGDDNVLFMLDRNDNPMIGNADFSYTLDRKTGP